MKHNIYLTGFMGTGKSTVSRILAGALGFEEIDTDAEIARQQGVAHHPLCPRLHSVCMEINGQEVKVIR